MENIIGEYRWFYTREHKMIYFFFKLGNFALSKVKKLAQMAKFDKTSKVPLLFQNWMFNRILESNLRFIDSDIWNW